MPRESRVVYRFIAGNLALDFANTVHCVGLPDPLDELKTIGDLLDWARRAEVLHDGDLTRLAARFRHDHARARRALTRALRLRSAIYELFSQLAENGSFHRRALGEFNVWYRWAMNHARIAQRVNQQSSKRRKSGDRRQEPGTTGLVLAWEPSSLGALDTFDHVLWQVTRAAADLLLSSKSTRVRQCSDQYCSWLFVDASRNGRRRWCSMQLCGNRARVRSYRRRQSL
jgi:predicted RNA-binding Zn ribbon-like protein